MRENSTLFFSCNHTVLIQEVNVCVCVYVFWTTVKVKVSIAFRVRRKYTQ